LGGGDDWLKSKLSQLLEYSKELCEDGLPHYPAHSWSVVKLLVLAGWVWVYTTIIPKYYDEYWYVDLLAGSGTTFVEETGDVVPGSAFVAHYFAREKFRRYVLVEKSEDRFRALSQRAARVMGDLARPLRGDCNELAGEIADEIREAGAHALVFIDNEGLRAAAEWETVKTLMGVPSDLIILFPTVGARRPWGSAQDGERLVRSLDRFYGTGVWRLARGGEDLLSLYLERLRKAFLELRGRRPFVSSIRIGTRSYYYDLILVCKDGPYVRAWDHIKSRLDWEDPETVGLVLRILRGEIVPLDFFTDLEEQVGGRGRQETLDRYF